jgi:CheY-like chemotaxis protein
MKKILIIEDNDDNMDLCLLVLKDKFEVLASYNGTDGLNKLRSEKPDLILLDLSLPDMDGLDIAHIVKESDELKTIPIIALTAHGMESDRERAKNAGCDQFIEKPFEIKNFLEVINSLI